MQRPDRPPHRETPRPARPLAPVLAPTWVGFPAALTSFVGREQEISQVSAMLTDDAQRLVTLVGPGGVGKSRLALAVAEHLEDTLADGAAFVPLAAVGQPEDVPAAVAAVLGIVSHPERSTTQTIIDALANRRTLLILDNLEHLIGPPVAEFVLALLEHCPQLQMLVTSRQPLRLGLEQRFVTPPLPVPPAPETGLPPEQSAAVQLFVARASAARQDFLLAPGDAAAVVEICRRLYGLPLAIELAAAWTCVLMPAALLARLTTRLPLLIGANADQPGRFQTMRAAIRWSYDLLTSEEALTLRRLSVFRGGFTLEAAARITLSDAGNPAEAELAMLNLIAALCDKSMLTPLDAVGTVQRFGMLETVREFAHEQLAATGELAGAETTHACYTLEWLERIEPDFLGPREEHWMALYSAEVGNLQAALHWGMEHDAELAQRIGAALWAYWCFQNPREGLRWLTNALDAAGSSPDPIRSRALRTAAAMAALIGEYEQAYALASEALELALEAGESWLEGEARWILGICDTYAGRIDQGEAHLNSAVALLEPVLTPLQLSTSAYARSALGVVAFLRDYRALGMGLYDRAIADLRTAGGAGIPMIVFTDYAGWLIGLDRVPQARELLLEALRLARRTPDSWLIGGILICLALADAVEGHTESAVRHLGAVEAVRVSRGVAIPLQFQSRIDQATAITGSSLTPAAFTETFTYGRLNAPEIIDYLLTGALDTRSGDLPRQAARRFGLTRRECDVLPYLVAGLSDREIAANLFISHRTASRHVSSILQRLNASSRAEAAVRAVRLGLD